MAEHVVRMPRVDERRGAFIESLPEGIYLQVASAALHGNRLKGFCARHAVNFCWQVSTGAATFAAHVVSAVAQAVTLSTLVASSAHVAAVCAQLTTAVTGRVGRVTPSVPATQVAPVCPHAVTAVGVVA